MDVVPHATRVEELGGLREVKIGLEAISAGPRGLV